MKVVLWCSFLMICAGVWLCCSGKTINFDSSEVILCLTLSDSWFVLCWVVKLYTLPSFKSMSTLPRQCSTRNDCLRGRLRDICPFYGTCTVSGLFVSRTIPFRALANLQRKRLFGVPTNQFLYSSTSLSISFTRCSVASASAIVIATGLLPQSL